MVYIPLWLTLLAITYLVKQKIRGHTYVYEAENFWDPEKKQSRQKRNYLGVWDEASRKLIPKVAERDVKTTKSLGPAYLLDSVGNEIQLRKRLSEAFGKDRDLIGRLYTRINDKGEPVVKPVVDLPDEFPDFLDKVLFHDPVPERFSRQVA